jgi:hypothetical protein
VLVIVFHGWSAAVGLTEFHEEDNHLSRDRRDASPRRCIPAKFAPERREIGGMIENAAPLGTMDVAVAAQANARHQPVASPLRDPLKPPSQGRAGFYAHRRVGVRQGLCGAVRRSGVPAAYENIGDKRAPTSSRPKLPTAKTGACGGRAKGTAEDPERKT